MSDTQRKLNEFTGLVSSGDVVHLKPATSHPHNESQGRIMLTDTAAKKLGIPSSVLATKPTGDNDFKYGAKSYHFTHDEFNETLQPHGITSHQFWNTVNGTHDNPAAHALLATLRTAVKDGKDSQLAVLPARERGKFLEVYVTDEGYALLQLHHVICDEIDPLHDGVVERNVDESRNFSHFRHQVDTESLRKIVGNDDALKEILASAQLVPSKEPALPKREPISEATIKRLRELSHDIKGDAPTGGRKL